MATTLLDIARLEPTLFDGMVLPEGMNPELMVNTIMTRYYSLEPLYPDPCLFSHFITQFFQRRKYNYQKLYESMYFEYNPIENYDRFSNTVRKVNREENESVDSTGTRKLDSEGSQTNHVTTENTVSAYNSDSYEPNNKTDTDGTNSIRNVDSENSSDTTLRDRTNKDKEEFFDHTHGNIGVTTSQQMIEAERSLVKWSIYDYIANDFAEELLIFVW